MHTKTQKIKLALVPFRQKLIAGSTTFVSFLRLHATPQRLAIGGSIGLALLVGGLAASFFWPRNVNLSYAGTTCLTQPVILPSLISKKQSASFTAQPVASVSVAGYPLFSRTTCLTPTQAPRERTTEVVTFGTGFLTKSIRISTGALPSLANQNVLQKPVSTRDFLTVPLSSADTLFEYRLVVGETTIHCAKKKAAVACDVAALKLAQSTTYPFTLQRLFKRAPAGDVFKRALPTVEGVSVVASSIAAGQMVQEVPSDLTLTFNRSVTSVKEAHVYLGENREEVATKTSLTDKTLTIRFEQPLARSATFTVIVDGVEAADRGFLATPFSMAFSTSGGPKVKGISIGSYKVATTSSIALTFDSTVSTTQAVAQFIRLEAAGSPVATTISLKNNVLTIKPAAALPRCAALTVTVLDGLQNAYGVAGGSAWQFKSRTLCQTVFSIGTSVQGRSITAYSFGSGPSKIIFVGTTHGDEKSSTYTLQSWVDYLESHATSIPANRTIIVIPNLNPDGYAASRRTNANNVDLNRNFPADDWKQGVTMPDKSFNPNGGGAAPLSEPESKALANYIQAQDPRLVLTYHAAAGVVIPNDAGDSVDLAKQYAQKSNVGYASNGQTGDIFEYDTTGSFETWLHDEPNISTLLIELWTKSSNQFTKHQNAMWAMVQLP